MSIAIVVNEKQSAQSYQDVSGPDTSPGGSLRHYFSYFLLSVSWLHPFCVAVTVSNETRTPKRENTGGIDLATYGEAHGVSIP